MKPIIVLAIAIAVPSASCGPATSGNGGVASNHGSAGAPTAVQSEATTVPQIGVSATAVGSNTDLQRDQSEKHQNGYTEDASNATMVGALKQELVGSAKLDGQSITDVQLRSRCQTIITTRAGQTLIDWSGIGNFARSVDKGVATIPINDGHGEHTIRLPEGAGSERVDGGFGLLAGECGSR